ncbi:hypothetical protein [Streptococcus pacificus]|uniref:Lipoprotein n=1 Tax=Streptococcus pacificus TaxID=2740577 RepID=A0ABS0ZHP8_9STRE|nr:hypothetical protein [Streptococcus pacificus]MBJ8325520.1 hypothetical protein [Streptococcus pacificus]
MKKLFLTSIVAVSLFAFVGCSNNTNSSQSNVPEKTTTTKKEQLEKKETTEEVNENSENLQKQNLDSTKRVGDDRVGYYDIPEDFISFTDIGRPDSTDVQYSDSTGENIISFNVVNPSDLPEGDEERDNLKIVAIYMASLLQDTENFEDFKINHFGNFGNELYQIVAFYSTGLRYSGQVFEDNGMIYIFTVEGSEEFVNKHWSPILKSFSPTK